MFIINNKTDPMYKLFKFPFIQYNKLMKKKLAITFNYA